jgi:hypothetical protein
VGAVKKLLVLLLVVALGVMAYRRLSGSHDPTTSGRTHQHGTPDHWPPIVRKPGSKTASTAPAA